MTAPLPVTEAALALERAGIEYTGVPAPLGRGCDNAVVAATASDGRELVVRVAISGRARFNIAQLAGQRAAEQDIPVPAVLWHDQRACVETRLPGAALADTSDQETATRIAAAEHAGRLLRRWHNTEAIGFGALDEHGRGRYPDFASWLLALPDREATGLDQHTFQRAAGVLAEHSGALPKSRMLHGDLVGRHLLCQGGAITGVIDLDSARAGDPLSEISGWTLRGPADLQEPLIGAYFSASPTAGQQARIAVYRVRILLSMLAFHVARRDDTYTAALSDVLTCDVDDLARDQPRLLPGVSLPADPLHPNDR